MENKLIYISEYSEYASHITNYIGNTIPLFHINGESKLEAIMKLLIASRNIRLGPAPSVESQYEMRNVIRYYLSRNLPIPILVPAGPKKTKTKESVDLAEFSVLNLLNCLNNAVSEHYSPGLKIIIRLEDLTGKVLEPDYTEDMKSYIKDFIELIWVLGYENFIEAWTESTHFNARHFVKLTESYLDSFIRYLVITQAIPEEEWVYTKEYQALKDLGWKGLIPLKQREEYLVKYEKLYPGITFVERLDLMARYFAASLARKNLSMTGAKKEWEGGHLDIMFMAPVPGYVNPRRFYFRSIELKSSKKAIPFWRAKGFLKIKDNGDIRLTSTTWGEADNMDFFEGHLLLTRGDLEVKVKCDYILSD